MLWAETQEHGRRERSAEPQPYAEVTSEHGRMVAGSDTVPPADFWQEIAALHRYGLDAETAMASATTTARSYLGLRDLEEGAPADVVLYHADPRHDPEVLEHPALVMVGGEVIAKAGASA